MGHTAGFAVPACSRQPTHRVHIHITQIELRQWCLRSPKPQAIGPRTTTSVDRRALCWGRVRRHLFRAGVFDLPTPFIPGIEVTGRIRALGPGVTGWDNGQPVAALLNDFGRSARAGGYAAVAVAHTSLVTALPEDADLAGMAGVLVNGVTVERAAEAHQALQNRTAPPKTVLAIHGT